MRPDLPHPRPHQASGSPFLHVPSSKVPSSPGLCPFVVRGAVRAEAAASGLPQASEHHHHHTLVPLNLPGEEERGEVLAFLRLQGIIITPSTA